MSRPSPHTRALDASTAGWVSRMSENFSECMDEPFPMVLYADLTALDAAANAKLFTDCLSLVGASGSARLYTSDGTNNEPYLSQLDFIADLDTGTATIADIRTAYNSLLTDMQAKGYML